MADFEKIRENDFNLNIPRYVDTFEEEAEIDIDAVRMEIEQLEKELAPEWRQCLRHSAKNKHPILHFIFGPYFAARNVDGNESDFFTEN